MRMAMHPPQPARERLALHIGPIKTGTTYLQRILAGQRRSLARANWLYPGPSVSQTPAITGLLGRRAPWGPFQHRGGYAKKWCPLSRRLGAWSGHTLLSCELLAGCNERQIDELLRALDRPAVDIVITARPLVSLLPSLWQAHVRGGSSLTAEAYYGHVAHVWASGQGSRHERGLSLSTLVSRWRTHARVARVVVVTAPTTTEPDTLWTRFGTAVGLPETQINLPLRDEDGFVNRGLGCAQLRLLRALAAEWRRRGLEGYALASQLRPVIERMQSHREQGLGGARLVLHSKLWRQRVAQWAAEDTAKLQRMDVDIVGDWTDLTPPVDESIEDMPDPALVPDSEREVLARELEPWLRHGRRRPLSLRRAKISVSRRVREGLWTLGVGV